jgi:hypothetical protein
MCHREIDPTVTQESKPCPDERLVHAVPLGETVAEVGGARPRGDAPFRRMADRRVRRDHLATCESSASISLAASAPPFARHGYRFERAFLGVRAAQSLAVQTVEVTGAMYPSCGRIGPVLKRVVVPSIVLVLGCGARSDLGTPETADATIDAIEDTTQDASVDGASPLLCPAVPPPRPGLNWGPCPPACAGGAPVTVGPITLSAPTCIVDAVIQEGERGVIVYPCHFDHYTFDAGGMQIVAEFPEDYPQTEFFNGTLDENDILSVCTATTFLGSDGCTWATVQTITGAVPTACQDQMIGPFTFNYAEQPIAGTNCNPACTATAPLVYTP